jgi:RNA-binding protein MEX3
MPATLFSDLEFSANQHNNKIIEDTRALQVALELSMLYMNGEQRQQKADSPMSGGPSMDSSSMVQNYIPNGFPEEPRNKKSQNMTECVPVPSSEHVAEIVGRQGNILFIIVSIFNLNVQRIVMVQQRKHCVTLQYANIAFKQQ